MLIEEKKNTHVWVLRKHPQTHISPREVYKSHHWDEEEEEEGEKMRRGKSGPECCLVAPCGNDGTSVTEMTVRVAGLFLRPLVHCDGLDRQGGWSLRGDDRLHFHFNEKSGQGS